MGDIVVLVDRVLDATPETVFRALADYREVRPQILPDQMTGYALVAGGQGAGTRFGYHFHATKRRVRRVEAEVTEPQPGCELLEADQGSSLRVHWTVAGADGGRSRVAVRVSWAGGGGIGGFFERRFAPGGVRRVYGAELDRLAGVLR